MKAARKKIDLEALFAQQLTDAGLSFRREFRFCPTRRWRADFLLLKPDQGGGDRVLVQIDGGGQFGAHGTSRGIRQACERDSAAACMGYRVIRADRDQVKSRKALRWVLCALGLLDNPGALFVEDGSDRNVERLVASLPLRVRRAAGMA